MAFVDVRLAVRPGETVRTRARVRRHAVGAISAGKTRRRQAVVDVRFASIARVAVDARARVAVDCVHARGPVLTGVRRAFVDVRLAFRSRVAPIAGARVRGDAVDARTLEARIRIAIIDVDLAVLAGVANWARAGVVKVSVVTSS